MSYLNERERQLVLDLLLGRVSEDDFFRAFRSGPGEIQDVSLEMLKQALQKRDPVGVELGLHLGHRFGFSPAHLDTLCALTDADWHERHEDVVDGLANLGEPACVETLYQTALSTHQYLEYDEANTLGVKAIRALGRIRTLEAIARLGDLLRSDDDILASEAELQLARIKSQSKSEEVRMAAQKALERD